MVSDTEIRKLIYEIRDDLFSSTSSISSIVKKYYSLLQYTIREDQLIKGELVGFYKIKIPNYRIIIIKQSPIYASSQPYVYVQDPISVVEKFANIGMTKEINDPVLYNRRINITPKHLHHIVESVKTIVLNLINKDILEQEYLDVNYNIFKDTKKYVDEKISELNPELLEDLLRNYKDLEKVDSTNSASKVAFSCRQILEDFTDIILNVEYLGEGVEKPVKSKTINKVKLLLSPIKSKTDKDLIESQINYFVCFNDFIQKNVHPESYSLYKEDANRCIIYTYLIIGDILKKLDI